MTKYEVGKWYGWNNDGDCPVHPKSEIEGVMLVDGKVSFHQTKSKLFIWKSNSAQLIAFRIIKEHKEPEVIWVNFYSDGCKFAHKTEEEAIKGRKNQFDDPYRTCTTKKFVEVME